MWRRQQIQHFPKGEFPWIIQLFDQAAYFLLYEIDTKKYTFFFRKNQNQRHQTGVSSSWEYNR